MDDDEKLILMGEEDTSPFGLPKWCKEYNRALINPADIKDEIDNYMEEYDRKVEEEEKRLKELTTEPDEEGWVTITKKGRNPGFARKESVLKNIMKKNKLKQKKKQLINFYSFQIKESKMNQLIQLREKFEEDKKKIELMKQSRKFKPF
ncbi:putative ribosomal RNA-processing protein 7 homolog B [Halyomorpha halys]|uniref:putative ribosomal RNA-processing protein 7 homolog B n=1 Tax=Halyomorpha halys TaxID=286706 RepID=UPI0034D1C003